MYWIRPRLIKFFFENVSIFARLKTDATVSFGINGVPISQCKRKFHTKWQASSNIHGEISENMENS